MGLECCLASKSEPEQKPCYRGVGKIWRLGAPGVAETSMPELGAPALVWRPSWLSRGKEPTQGED